MQLRNEYNKLDKNLKRLKYVPKDWLYIYKTIMCTP